MSTIELVPPPSVPHAPPAVGAHAAAPAFRAIFDAELDYVWNALGRLGVPERDRPDVAHDVFVAVHRQLATYDPTRPLRPWLFAFAFRCASAYRRRSSNRFETLTEEAAEPRDPAPGVDDVLGARSLLAKALATLDEDKRAALIMYELEGWPVAEIAHALGEPQQTIYSRLRTGREELARALRRLGLEDGRRSTR